MEETTLKIKLSKRLLEDLELITKNEKTSKETWIKNKIKKLISRERKNQLQKTDSLYEKGIIDEQKYKKLTGEIPTKTMKENRARKIKKNQGPAKKYIEYLKQNITKKQ